MLGRLIPRSTQVRFTASLAHTRAKERIDTINSTRPFTGQFVDSFNRKHNYLRISLTERCNLRCFYCMPSEGVELSPEGKLLTNSEILRLASLFVKSGITKIRLTGGEPTVRKGIMELMGEFNQLKKHGLESLAMTTNGLALHRRLPAFVENGLTHLNLSLDTLDPFKFEIITRRRGHEAVLKALDAALNLPLESIKLNVVVIRGLNDSEVLDFVNLTQDKPISVRFIEFMPFTGNKWDKNKMVPSSELLERIRARYPGVQRASDEVNDTARSWYIPGHRGSFGFISSMSDHFCGTCNRLRLTADGQIKANLVCLFDPKEISLRDTLRAGASDQELLQIIHQAVLGKKEKHAGMEDIDVVTNRPMILIGHNFPNLFAKRSRRGLGHAPSFTRAAPSPSFQLRAYSTNVRLTHLDDSGRASMVDVSDKIPSKRTATAQGRIYITKIAYELITSTYADNAPPTPESRAIEKARRKGDALTVAQLAGIMGAKRTADLIPLCHPLALSKVDVKLVSEAPSGGSVDTRRQTDKYSVLCMATVTCEGKTGVEMEALTAVSVTLLTVWDMLKAVAGKEMEITDIIVSEKAGGKSGNFSRKT
ncbi:molybdenum cofactor biosynthesis prote [Macrolepiota fuliginosa MF-IS2]|uniref:Molybdenum cofactor biosynthesis prote n=1 Tax=Macrolepiota fuliginosa MF-IS2 TaxID=1400762 RepID=A0A9P5XMF1_9AGAR|nr:molybdenum cofactor biosynthesis prote [Macrolepiota fuliginosa MF-IS2]